MCFGRVDQHGRAAFRLQPQRTQSRQARNFIHPGAGGVDDQWRRQRFILGGDFPQAIAAGQTPNFAAGVKFPAALAQALQKPLQDGIHVQVAEDYPFG